MQTRHVFNRYGPAILALVSAAMISGCGAESTGSVVSSSSTTAASTSAALCQLDDLRTAGQDDPNNNDIFTTSFTNKGSASCTIEGVPAIALVKDNGQMFGGPAKTDSTAHPVTKLVLTPGQSAGFQLTYTKPDSMTSAMCTKDQQVTKTQITLPENTKPWVITSAPVACTNLAPTTTTVTPMYSVPTPPAVTPAG